MRTTTTVSLLWTAAALLLAGRAPAQVRALGPDAPPDSVAAGFQTALRAGAWEVVATLMDPDGLDRFRRLLRIVTDADGTGAVLDRLLPGASPDDLASLPGPELFVRAARTLGEELPGMAHSLGAREVTVLGGVREPPDRVHVVYRNRDLLAGAVPRIRVMTLRRREAGWRVVDSDELDLIREAIRGLARTRPPRSRSRERG